MLYFRPIQQGLKCQHKCQVVSFASRFESQMPFYRFHLLKESWRTVSRLSWSGGLWVICLGARLTGSGSAVVFISSFNISVCVLVISLGYVLWCRSRSADQINHLQQTRIRRQGGFLCVCGAVSRHIWDENRVTLQLSGSQSSWDCSDKGLSLPTGPLIHADTHARTHSPVSEISIWRSVHGFYHAEWGVNARSLRGLLWACYIHLIYLRGEYRKAEYSFLSVCFAHFGLFCTADLMKSCCKRFPFYSPQTSSSLTYRGRHWPLWPRLSGLLVWEAINQYWVETCS